MYVCICIRGDQLSRLTNDLRELVWAAAAGSTGGATPEGVSAEVEIDRIGRGETFAGVAEEERRDLISQRRVFATGT